MNKDELKAIGCTSIEDLITEDFGALGTEERNAFKNHSSSFSQLSLMLGFEGRYTTHIKPPILQS